MTKLIGWTERHWRLMTLLAWLILAGVFLYERWSGIQAFALGDTDDNLRMSEVRALLAGQDWFDLRQYRLNPPYGADIHWSRFVDLPLAGIILLMRPLVGGIDAERIAVAAAPLIALVPVLFALALAVRRLVDPRAYLLAFAAFFYAGSASGMFMPLRIDHHGWQLALLAVGVAGIADAKRARGGATLGIASGMSLWIGLEMLIYLAIAGVAMVLFWVQDKAESRRLAAYSAGLSGATALGFALFASYANRHPVCDALSPVWLSDALLGGALLLGLAWLSPGDWKRRLALAAGAGVMIALFHAALWPQCLTRLEGVSPEAQRLWLDNVREARPLYRHEWRIAVMMAALPITGLVGWALLCWRARTDAARFRRTLAAAAPAFAATVLLLWQTRTGPAAQLLGIIGAVGLVWIVAPLAWRSRLVPVRTLGVVALVVAGLGAAVPLAMNYLPAKTLTARERAISLANRSCNSIFRFKPIAQQPKGMVFTFVDYGPRLITVTHHDAVTGPYHRNDAQIADVMTAFRSDAEKAHRIIARYKSDYVLICPNSSTTTLFMAAAPKGFYAQLNSGKVPAWLAPIEMPKDSPFKMWRVLGQH